PLTSRPYPPSLHDALPIFEQLPQAADAFLSARVAAEFLFHPPEDFGILALNLDQVQHPLGLLGGDPRLVDHLAAHGVAPLLGQRSEEHTSELQSHLNLVCR